MENETISIKLNSDEALVLFDLVSRLNDSDNPAFEHESEKRVLWDIECMLEKQIQAVLKEDYT